LSEEEAIVVRKFDKFLIRTSQYLRSTNLFVDFLPFNNDDLSVLRLKSDMQDVCSEPLSAVELTARGTELVPSFEITYTYHRYVLRGWKEWS
jgi:hypothetical protein